MLEKPLERSATWGSIFNRLKLLHLETLALALKDCPLVEEKEMAFIRFAGRRGRGWGGATKSISIKLFLKMFIEVMQTSILHHSHIPGSLTSPALSLTTKCFQLVFSLPKIKNKINALVICFID